MARWVYMLTAFAALAAWAGAQGPAPAQLTAEDKLRLLRANSQLIDNLVGHGVDLSNAGDPVQQAAHCRLTAGALARAVEAAAKQQEAERVAVLTLLFRDVVRDGFLPTHAEAKEHVTPESPGAKHLKQLRSSISEDVTKLKAAIPTSGKVGDSARVRDALKQLDELTESLKEQK